MERCTFCKRVPSQIFKPKGLLLKAIQKTQPNTTEDTPMCSTCYNKAVAQLNRYKQKVRRNLATHLATMSVVESVRSSNTSSSIDSIDRLILQRSMRSIQRMRQQAAQEEQKKVPSPRRLEFTGRALSHSQRQPDAYSDLSSSDVAMEAPVAEVQNSSESSDNPLDPIESTSSQSVPSNAVVRVYESDEEIEVERPDDRLPGVQPYIRKRRTRVIFTDERLIPIYNNKSFGG